jgi:hypothetical protein
VTLVVGFLQNFMICLQNYLTDFNAVFLIDIVIQEEGVYVYNMHNIAEKHFISSLTPVESRDGSLVHSYLKVQT